MHKHTKLLIGLTYVAVLGVAIYITANYNKSKQNNA